MSKADELARLVAARDAGEMTDEEFDEAKRQVLAAPATSTSGPTAELDEPTGGHRRRNRRRAYAVAVAIVLALTVWVVVGLASLSPARFSLEVHAVHATASDSVNVALVWTNQGDRAGAGTCTISTAVHDAAGALLEDQLSTVTTNGTVAAGRHQSAVVQVIVNNGDASHVSRRDVTVAACQ